MAETNGGTTAESNTAPAAHSPRNTETAVSDAEKATVEHGTVSTTPATPHGAWIPDSDDEYEVTFKTWIVVFILSASYGISFWIVPALSSCATTVATLLGDTSAAAWYISIYLVTITIAFMICGANSDLFGRRWFITGGNALLFVGFIVGGSARSNTAMLAAMGLIGFGAGNAQLAAFALPELLPNKWRHIAIVIADLFVLFSAVVGPVAGRFAVAVSTSAWRWLFYGPAMAAALSFGGLFMYYYPPAHPRGLPFKQALRALDFGGALLFTVAATLTLTGIVYSIQLPSSDPKVVGTLVSGLGMLVVFGLYETFVPLAQPLTPTRVFTKGRGRDLTAPFVAAFVVTMFYYAINVIWPTMINVFFTDAATSFRYQIVLTLPANLGLCLGAFLLSVLGTRIGHWRWTLTASVTVMVVFGALLAVVTPERKGLAIALVFIEQMGFGWAQYLSIAFVQFGTDQVELGIAGGLAGVSRFAGGTVAISVFSTILSNVTTKQILKLVPAAAMGAGLPASSVSALIAALAQGSAALEAVPGISDAVIAAASKAYQQAYVVGLRTTALSSLSFGIVAIIACLFCNNIDDKMNNKIEIFLENDVHADKNRFH
ncbi:trichothecene efflux pump [Ophiostoma piceae UAMH 11346]|uniref:Trichothecene efflux pump n=1 Tax=Ophiostoma piceae (strain UAMH 11346) TaxID=1262450 RepID=S3CD97_OPHP1|nr:trichothecene efflux pump [Ophiostoma piceae UAMH 11346]